MPTLSGRLRSSQPNMQTIVPKTEEGQKILQAFRNLLCTHWWVEAVDDEGHLIEPAYDVCLHCGETR